MNFLSQKTKNTSNEGGISVALKPPKPDNDRPITGA